MSGQRGKGVPWHGSAPRDAPLRRWTAVRQRFSWFYFLLLLRRLFLLFVLVRRGCDRKIVLDRLELRAFIVKLGLQSEGGAEARLIFVKPAPGIRRAASLTVDLHLEMVEDVLELGDEPEGRRVGFDLDTLGEIATLQNEQGDR